MRTSPEYDTHFGGKTDSYWDRVAESLRERKGICAEKKGPYELIPVANPAP